MKILLIRFSSIGDILLITPLIKTIKKLLPDSKIYMLTKNKYQEILQHNNNISEVISLNQKGLFDIITYINKKKFDIIVDLHNNIKSNLIRIFCHSGLKITYKKDIFERRFHVLNSLIRRKLKERDISSFELKIMRHDDLKDIIHTTDRYFHSVRNVFPEAIDGLHIKNKRKPEVIITDTEREFAAKFLEEKKVAKNDILIGFNPGGKNLTKRWHSEKYIELAKKIIEELKAKIIIFGDENDIETTIYIEKNINNIENVIYVAGKTNLLQLSSLIERCKLFITGDTGPMHIANSFEVPVIAIFGPTVVDFGFYPTGINDVVLCLDLFCRPCSLHGSKKCPIGSHDCMRNINVDDVFKIVHEKIRGNI